MSPRSVALAGTVAIAALVAAWWAVKARHDVETDIAQQPMPVTKSVMTAEPGGARCLDREGQLIVPLADGQCPIARAGSRLAPDDSERQTQSSCDSAGKTAPAASQDPVLAALQQGVCY